MGRDEVQSKALSIITSINRCSLAISMGVGKTRIALQHMMKNYNKFSSFLVVAPKKTIIAAWQEECDKMNATYLLDHIKFSTYLSLNKQNPNDFDVVYLDECHSLLMGHRDFLDRFKGKILGLTGTPPTYGEKAMLVDEFCPMVYNFKVDDATDNNILNDYRIIVHMLPLDNGNNLPKKRKDGGHWYTSEVKDYEYHTGCVQDAPTTRAKQLASIMRMKAMQVYGSKEKYTKQLIGIIKEKCIIFANTQKQADGMCKHSFHSKNKNSNENLELFSNGTIDKLSCVLQLSEGVSIPGLRQGIIMHAYGNERKSAQRIGRLLRLNPDETAMCHILCYKNTIDEQWVKKALADFSKDKVKYFEPTKKQLNG